MVEKHIESTALLHSATAVVDIQWHRIGGKVKRTNGQYPFHVNFSFFGKEPNNRQLDTMKLWE